jgi:uncharacterized C2H2 Zn-finger protein
MSNSNRSNSNSNKNRTPKSSNLCLTDEEIAAKAKRSASTRKAWISRRLKQAEQAEADPPRHGTESQLAIVNKMVREPGNTHDGQLVGLDLEMKRLTAMLEPKTSRLSTPIHNRDSRMMLYGPPGNGKTALVQAAAAASGATFFAPTADQLCSAWSGEAEGIIATMFDEAVECAPSVIFVDEIDSIGRQRDFSNTSRHNEAQTVIVMLQKMDELKREHPDKRVCLVAATNHVEALDIALIRRFPERIYVGRPSPQQRVDTVRRMFLETDTPLHLEPDHAQWVANHTAGFSYSEVVDLVHEAAYLCLDEVDETDKTAILPPTTIAHFREALKYKTATIDLKEELIKRHQEDLRRSTTTTPIEWHQQYFTPVPGPTPLSLHHQHSTTGSFTSTAAPSSSNSVADPFQPRPLQRAGEKRLHDQDEALIDFYERDNDAELSHICEIATELRQSEPSNQIISSSFLPPRTTAPMKKQTTQPIQYIQIPSERYLAFQRYEEQQRGAPESLHPVTFQTPQLQLPRTPTPAPVQCPRCSQPFNSTKLLMVHQQREHPHICPYCEASFVTKASNLRHIQSTHLNQPFQQ